jgi:CheY-like chemotaxis protein
VVDGDGAALGVEAARRLAGLGRVEIKPGLTETELARVETQFGFVFADDHRALLAAGSPVGRRLRDAYTERPDLVVLDIGLPGIDGWQVLERLRDVSDVPVLLLTAHGPESDKYAACAAAPTTT